MDYPLPEYLVTFSYTVGGRALTAKYVTKRLKSAVILSTSSTIPSTRTEILDSMSWSIHGSCGLQGF
jgi:hypothetical protein